MLKYLDKVPHNTDNIFRAVLLERPKYPIQHWDKIHVNQCRLPLCYWSYLPDPYVLNQSGIKLILLRTDSNVTALWTVI